MISAIDIIVCIAYFAIVIGVGIFAFRKAKSKEDFLVAGRSLPLPMFTAAMAAVVIGGGCTIGGTTLAYESGIGGIWVGGMYAISIFLLAWLLRTKMSNMRILSTNEGVGIFYGERTDNAHISLYDSCSQCSKYRYGSQHYDRSFHNSIYDHRRMHNCSLHYYRWNVGSSLHRYYTVYSNDYRCYPDSSDTRPYTRRRI